MGGGPGWRQLVVAQEQGGTIPSRRPTFGAVVWDWTKTLVLCALIALTLRTLVLESYTIDGACMEPSLGTGQRVFIFKPSYWFSGPHRGDVIVFRYPVDPTRDYIKRVIALPGETVALRAGIVYINGKELDQSHWPITVDTYRYSDYQERVVPDGQYFVLGDNRPDSEDSRVWGFVPRENVKGEAFIRYWPIWRPKWIG